MTLRDCAHTRTGDKGNTLNISVIAFTPGDYVHIKQYVTAERIREHFKDFARGSITRYELPALQALNFVIEDALQGGVTRSLALDTHGKSLSSALLSLEIPDLAAD